MFIKFALILSVLFCFEINAQNIDTQTFNKIDTYIKKVQKKANIPAVSIGIIKDDSLVYKKSYSKDEKVSADSLFYIGSLTKSFTALAIMQLVEDGKINLDDPLKKYLPWFEIQNMQSVDKITIRTLLNQTSGFSTYEGLKNFDNWDSSSFTLEKTIRALKGVRLASKPSTTFQYSNINYQILGLVIQKITGLSYNDYIKENIFNKLDMKNSFASLKDIDAKQITQGHRLWFGEAIESDFPFSKVMLPAGYIISNVEDMSKYLIAQLNNGIYKKEQVFSPSMIKQIQTPSATVIKDKFHYAFGWFVDTNNNISLSHMGSVPGYTSKVIMYPQEKLALVMLTNTTAYALGQKELNNLASNIMNIIKNKKINTSEFDLVSISAYIFFIGFIIAQLFLLRYFIKKLKSASKYKIILFLVFDIIIVISLYLIVPLLYNLTFSVFLMFTPDIGYLMLGSIIVAILSAIVKINRLSIA
ncbi:serine hydrolase domain-containing protein [Sulfurimonas sp.]|uniref:serine hydrolase domain-containing protein n=1 Tax=Sulfurimonas sp. TaxID=2022749 RepID=UPI0025D529A0|nr:serine hydrolase domain-containing protein [Sulfurimonas sp.]